LARFGSSLLVVGDNTYHRQIFSDMILFRDLVKFIAYSSAVIVFIITYGSNTVELFVKWEIISLADGKITVIPLANYL